MAKITLSVPGGGPGLWLGLWGGRESNVPGPPRVMRGTGCPPAPRAAS